MPDPGGWRASRGHRDRAPLRATRATPAGQCWPGERTAPEELPVLAAAAWPRSCPRPGPVLGWPAARRPARGGPRSPSAGPDAAARCRRPAPAAGAAAWCARRPARYGPRSARLARRPTRRPGAAACSRPSSPARHGQPPMRAGPAGAAAGCRRPGSTRPAPADGGPLGGGPHSTCARPNAGGPRPAPAGPAPWCARRQPGTASPAAGPAGPADGPDAASARRGRPARTAGSSTRAACSRPSSMRAGPAGPADCGRPGSTRPAR